MALSLIIEYKDPTREPLLHPFSFQSVLIKRWWPLAEQLGLPLLQQLECLWITDRAEAQEFVAELRAVERHLRQPGQADEYMLTRIAQLVPIMEQAIAEWDQIAGVSV